MRNTLQCATRGTMPTGCIYHNQATIIFLDDTAKIQSAETLKRVTLYRVEDPKLNPAQAAQRCKELFGEGAVLPDVSDVVMHTVCIHAKNYILGLQCLSMAWGSFSKAISHPWSNNLPLCHMFYIVISDNFP